MNGLVKLLIRVGIKVGITKAIEYFVARAADPETPEDKAAAKSGRQSAKRATRLINLMRRFSRF